MTDRGQLARLAAAAATAAPGRLAGVPASSTTFIGRTHEQDTTLLLLSRARLVTLLGPGGVGKTRLAAVVAEAAGPAFPFGGADEPERLVEEAFADVPQGRYQEYARSAAAELAVVAGLAGADRYVDLAAPAAAENDWAAACLARARGRLRGDRAALAAAVEGWARIGAAFERDYTAALLHDRASSRVDLGDMQAGSRHNGLD